jgi:hypothetical protein
LAEADQDTTNEPRMSGSELLTFHSSHIARWDFQ